MENWRDNFGPVADRFPRKLGLETISCIEGFRDKTFVIQCRHALPRLASLWFCGGVCLLSGAGT